MRFRRNRKLRNKHGSVVMNTQVRVSYRDNTGCWNEIDCVGISDLSYETNLMDTIYCVDSEGKYVTVSEREPVIISASVTISSYVYDKMFDTLFFGMFNQKCSVDLLIEQLTECGRYVVSSIRMNKSYPVDYNVDSVKAFTQEEVGVITESIVFESGDIEFYNYDSFDLYEFDYLVLGVWDYRHKKSDCCPSNCYQLMLGSFEVHSINVMTNELIDSSSIDNYYIQYLDRDNINVSEEETIYTTFHIDEFGKIHRWDRKGIYDKVLFHNGLFYTYTNNNLLAYNSTTNMFEETVPINGTIIDMYIDKSIMYLLTVNEYIVYDMNNWKIIKYGTNDGKYDSITTDLWNQLEVYSINTEQYLGRYPTYDYLMLPNSFQAIGISDNKLYYHSRHDAKGYQISDIELPDDSLLLDVGERYVVGVPDILDIKLHTHMKSWVVI